jgi:hypothetical protein
MGFGRSHAKEGRHGGSWWTTWSTLGIAAWLRPTQLWWRRWTLRRWCVTWGHGDRGRLTSRSHACGRWRPHVTKAWHARSRPPASICLDLLQLALSVTNREVHDSPNKQNQTVMSSV